MKTKSIVMRGLAALVLAGCFIGPAAASAYDGLYVFGDSLSDVGNLYTASKGTEPLSPPYSEGRFSNGNLWIQDVAASLGLGPVTPSLSRGNDFAYGGAQTGPTLANKYNGTKASKIQKGLDLPSQLKQFNAQVKKPKANALYTLWIGSNDLDALLDAVIAKSIAPADISKDLKEVLANIGTFVTGLAKDGMKNLLALDVTDLSKTPDAIAIADKTSNSTATLKEIQSVVATFDTGLSAELATLAQTDQFSLTYVDTFAPIDSIVADPTAYGLTNVISPCLTVASSKSPATVCSDPNQYLFWDGLHPTAAGHQLVADVVLEQVPEPGSIGLLAIGVTGLLLIRRRRAGRSLPL
ncbi:MAG: SGNH/GDSL hydrolase family protein [Acidiphilium sp.]|nr:SGNH/GDSL hydrolase family protein [Acidiphilium sp.]